MNILYLDTSSHFCEVALFQKNGMRAHNTNNTAMQHSTVLHSMVSALLAECNLSFPQVDAIGVMNGPGSYTGLRIGLAAAKSFCYSLNIPLLLLNKLEVGCDYFQHQNPAFNSVACIQFARDGEYFLALKKNKAFVMPTGVYSAGEINEILKRNNIVHLITTEDTIREDITPVPILMSIEKLFIGQQLNYLLLQGNVSNIFRAEPFYLKKVHANKPKRLF